MLISLGELLSRYGLTEAHLHRIEMVKTVDRNLVGFADVAGSERRLPAVTASILAAQMRWMGSGLLGDRIAKVADECDAHVID